MRNLIRLSKQPKGCVAIKIIITGYNSVLCEGVDVNIIICYMMVTNIIVTNVYNSSYVLDIQSRC